MDEATPRTVAGNFELTVVLTDKRQIRMTGYVYSDDEAHDINQRIDAYQDALDRQSIRADVTNKEAQLVQQDAGLEQLAAHYAAMVKLQQTGRKLTSQQKTQLDQYDTSVDFIKRQKDSLRAAIEEGRRKLNGAA